jgi:hypothetical protein
MAGVERPPMIEIPEYRRRFGKPPKPRSADTEHAAE